jgi:integrase
LTEGYNLTNRQSQQNNAQREGTPTQQEQTPSDNNGRIVSFLWAMKQNGKKNGTIRTWSFMLQKLAKHTDMTPDAVKEYLATTTDWTDATKGTVVTMYNSFLKHYNIIWEQPKYKAPDKLHFIPTEAEIDSLIAGSGRMLSTFLQFLKETGARGGEAANTQCRDVDFERKIVHITPEKGSKARILPISNKLIDMLNRQPKRSSGKIFSDFSSLRCNYHEARKNLIFKLQNPRLKDIHIHTFRHWKATIEYHKTKDILHVQQILGHRDIKSTMIYITLENALFQNTNEEYTIKTAKTVQEASDLLTVGFEYVTDMGDVKLFRKRK